MARLLRLLGLGLLIAPLARAQPLRPESLVYRRTDRPNFLLLVADDLSPEDLGCYGGAPGVTPNIDRIAAKGFRFTNAYAGAPADAAARAALLTGLHAGHGPVRDNREGPLRPDDITLAEVLRVASYPSGYMGRWSLGGAGTSGHPVRQGFTEFFGIPDRATWTNDHPAALHRNEEMVWFPENQRGLKKDYFPDWVSRATTNAVKLWQSQAFLVQASLPLPAPRTGSATFVRPGDPARVARVRELDAQVGRILDVLDRLHLGAFTHVILTSDQPGPPGDPNLPPWSEARLRVPLLIRPPGGLDAPVTLGDTVAAWDLMPTLAELAKTGAPRRIDGRSFAPLLQGKPRRRVADHLYWCAPETNGWEAVRFGKWKAVVPGPDTPLLLHDLESDPAGGDDVAAANPEVVAQARAHLKTARTPLPDPSTSAIPAPFANPAPAAAPAPDGAGKPRTSD